MNRLYTKMIRVEGQIFPSKQVVASCVMCPGCTIKRDTEVWFCELTKKNINNADLGHNYIDPDCPLESVK